jgi:hypothetical protein
MTNIEIPSPLGFCAKHLSRGVRVPATSLVDGTAACDRCTVESYATDVEQALHVLGVADRERGGKVW